LTEILYGLLRTETKNKIVIGGDFNHSIKFDDNRKEKFNKERFLRFNKMGLFDSLSYRKNKPVPTFVSRNKLIHQLDYLFVSKKLLAEYESATIERDFVLNNNISDHLPIYINIKS